MILTSLILMEIDFLIWMCGTLGLCKIRMQKAGECWRNLERRHQDNSRHTRRPGWKKKTWDAVLRKGGNLCADDCNLLVASHCPNLHFSASYRFTIIDCIYCILQYIAMEADWQSFGYLLVTFGDLLLP